MLNPRLINPPGSYINLAIFATMASSGERTHIAGFPHNASTPIAVESAPTDYEQEVNDEVWFGPATFSWQAQSIEEAYILANRYESWLGYDVQAEQYGRIVYQGKTWELTYTQGYTIRQKSLHDLANKVEVTHSGGSGSHTTTHNTQSADQYGQRTFVFNSSLNDATAAQNLAEVILQRRAFPIGGNAITNNYEPYGKLEIVCLGYLHTAAWVAESEITTTISGGSDTISEAITNVITNDLPFLTVGYIASNTETITALPSGNGLEVLLALAELGGPVDSNGIRPTYYLWIDQWNRVNYEKRDWSPRYFLTRDGLHKDASGSVSVPAHTVVPGVVRDTTLLTVEPRPDTPYEDSRDTYVEAVIARMGDHLPGFTSATLKDADLRLTSSRLTSERIDSYSRPRGSNSPEWLNELWRLTNEVHNPISDIAQLEHLANRVRGGN